MKLVQQVQPALASAVVPARQASREHLVRLVRASPAQLVKLDRPVRPALAFLEYREALDSPERLVQESAVVRARQASRDHRVRLELV